MIRTTTASLLAASLLVSSPALAVTWQSDVSNDWFGGTVGVDTNWGNDAFPAAGDDADIFNPGPNGSPVANAPITAGDLDIGGFINATAVSATINAGGTVTTLSLQGSANQTYIQNGGTMLVTGNIQTANDSNSTHSLNVTGGTFTHNGVITGSGPSQAMDISITNATFNSGGQGGASNTRNFTADLTNSDIFFGRSSAAGNFTLTDSGDSLNLTIGSNNAGGAGTNSIDSDNYFALSVVPTINAIGTGYTVGEIIELATITGDSINPNNFFASFPSFTNGQPETISGRVSGSSNDITFDLYGVVDNIFTGDADARVLLEVTSVVPEPASLALVGLGGAMLLGRRRSA